MKQPTWGAVAKELGVPGAARLPAVPAASDLGIAPLRKLKRTWADGWKRETTEMGWAPPTEEEIESLDQEEERLIKRRARSQWDFMPMTQAAIEAKGNHELELAICLFGILHGIDVPYCFERAAINFERKKDYQAALTICDLWLARSPRQRQSGRTTERRLLKRKNRLLSKLSQETVDLSDPARAVSFWDWVELKGEVWLSTPDDDAVRDVQQQMNRYELELDDFWSMTLQLDERIKGKENPNLGHGAEDATVDRRRAAVLWKAYTTLGGKQPRSYSDGEDITSLEELAEFDAQVAKEWEA